MLKNSLPSSPLLQDAADYARKWSEAGAQPVYDTSFASAIGGYPAGSVLQSADGSGFWISTADNNLSDPDGTAPANWEPHVFHGAATIAVGAVDVVLWPKEYAKPNLVISGALSADVAVILPSLVRQWVIRNESVGDHQVTVRTASGQGVVLRPGSQMVWGDGSNILPVTSSPTVSGPDGHYVQLSGEGGLKDSHQSASDASNAYVVTSPGSLPVGHIAKIVDTNGSIGDGGALGSVAGMNASDASNAYAVTSPGSLPVGHIAKIADANGSIGDGGVLGNVTGLNASSVAAGAGLSSVYSFPGNPNGQLAGRAAVVGVSPPDLCWDAVEQILWICTLSGAAATAVWQKVGGAEPVVSLSANHVVSTQDHSVNFVATAAVSITLPQANSIANGACAFSLSAQGGAVTLIPAGGDRIVVGRTVQTAGTAYTLAQGASTFVVGDGVGKWSLLSLSGPGSQPPAFRNLLIGGDFSTNPWQRGKWFANINGYGPDRWWCGRAGNVSGLSVSPITVTSYGSPFSALNMQRAAGDTNSAMMIMYQAIEMATCAAAGVAGKQVTLSFVAAAPGTPSVSTINAQVLWRTDGVEGGPATPGWSGSGAQQFTLAPSMQQFAATFSIPANATQLMVSIAFPVAGTAGASDQRYLNYLQLEVGATATPFEALPVDVVLSRCQRFYETGLSFYVAYAASSSGTLGTVMSFKTKKRVLPTCSIGIVAGAATGSTILAGSSDTLFVSFTVYLSIEGAVGTFAYNANAEL